VAKNKKPRLFRRGCIKKSVVDYFTDTAFRRSYGTQIHFALIYPADVPPEQETNSANIATLVP
jgi:hypothetical protein